MVPLPRIQKEKLAAMILGHRGLLLTLPLLPVVLFIAWSVFRPPLYSSTLVLSANRAELASATIDVQDAVDVELATAARLMASGEFMKVLFGQAGAAGVGGHGDPDSLLKQLRIEPVPGTRLLELGYVDRDSQRPARVLEHVASQFLAYRDQEASRRLQRETRTVLQRIGQLSSGLMGEQAVLEPSPGYWIPAAELSVQQPALQRVEETLMTRILTDYDNALSGEVQLSVADPATAPERIRSAGLLPASALLYAITVMLAVAGLWLRRQFSDSAVFPDRLAERLGIPLLGVLPAVPPSVMDEARFQGRIPDHDGYTEALRTVRTRLSLDERTTGAGDDTVFQGRQGRIVLVSEPISGEGATTTAAHLALMAGQVERVLLVDANLREGDPGRILFGLSRRDAGLSHLVAGAAPMHRCIHALREEGFDLMPAGIVPPNPQELLSSSRFRRALTVLQRRYDLIVIDAPPAADNSDILLLAGHAHRILYVTRPGGSDIKRARAGIRRLREAPGEARISLLCTGVDTGRLARYGDLEWLTGGGYRYRKPGGRFLVTG